MHLEWFDREPAPGMPPISTSVTPGESAMLRTLARGRDVLEIGSAYGYSACVMALAGGTVTAVDPQGPEGFDFLAAFSANVEACGVADRVTLIREFSQDALPRLAAEGRTFGLVFIDANHAYDAVRSDLTWALKLISPGGTIAMHDVLEDCCCPDVRRVAGDMLPGQGTYVDSMLVVTP